jgi:hypothetical protein
MAAAMTSPYAQPAIDEQPRPHTTRGSLLLCLLSPPVLLSCQQFFLFYRH